MSNKMTCPGCGSHTSSVRLAFEQDEACPHCGLSSSAAAEVLAARERGANTDLTAKYEKAVIERDRALTELARYRNYFARFTRLAGELQEDAKLPWGERS